MKLLKNLLALTLVLAMVLAFGACSDDKDASDASKDESKTEESSNAPENSDIVSDDSSVADDNSVADDSSVDDTSSDAVSDDSSAPDVSDSETSDSETSDSETTAAVKGTYAANMDLAAVLGTLMETEVDTPFNVTLEITFDGDKTATSTGSYDDAEALAFVQNVFAPFSYNLALAMGFEGTIEEFVTSAGGYEALLQSLDLEGLLSSFGGEYVCEDGKIAIKLSDESYMVGTFDDTSVTINGEYDAEGNLIDDAGFPMVFTKK